MPRIFWIIFGLFAGFFARTIAGRRSPKALFDIGLAIIGGLIGGWLFGILGYPCPPGSAEFGERSILIDLIGSATLFIIFQALTGSAD